MGWLNDLGFNDRRENEHPLFTQGTREETVECIRSLIEGKLTALSNSSTSIAYVFFNYPPDFISVLLRDHDVEYEIVTLTEPISFVKSICKLDHRGRPARNEQLIEIQELLRKANIPFLTIFDVNGRFEYPRRLIDSAAQYYFCEHSSGSTHYYRPDLKETFRSSWEANFARILNHKKMPYEYESHMLPRHDSDGSAVGVYIPDFWLPGNRVVEVKGFWNRESLEKVLEMKKHYPEYEYYIIDQDIYHSLTRQYSEVISSWEISTDHLSPQQIDVVGINFGNRKRVSEALTEGDAVTLCRDPNNPYDKNAVLVKSVTGEEIGFLSADWACVFSQKLDIGMKYNCHIVSKDQKVIRISALRNNLDEIVLFDFLKP